VDQLVTQLDAAGSLWSRWLAAVAAEYRASARNFSTTGQSGKTTCVICNGIVKLFALVWCCQDWSLWRLRRGTRATGYPIEVIGHAVWLYHRDRAWQP
jgi:hypothetical protein